MPASRTLLLIALGTASALAAQPKDPTDTWKLERIELKTGAAFDGLVVEQTVFGTKFRLVKRLPGKPTVTLTTFFTKAETKGVTALGEVDRKVLQTRLAELDGQELGNKQRMATLELTPVDWLGWKGKAKRYDGEQFTLISAAPDEITRRAALRLEQIYTAFARVLPPRQSSAKPTLIELAGTVADYEELLKLSSVKVLNAAVYFPAENRIVCGSDLQTLGDELTRAQFHHEKQRLQADLVEKDLRELYKGNRAEQRAELERHLLSIKKERDRITLADRENGQAFNRATRRLFGVLYHEAFHSYVVAFAFPPRTVEQIQKGDGTGELPRWLNEGLAQLFEDPIIEAGELRIGHADVSRLKAVQTWLATKSKASEGLIPLADLLKTGKEQFVTAHVNQKEMTDRSYLTSWALAYYLTFHRGILGTTALEDYLKAVNTTTDAMEAFVKFCGQELPAFEKDWHEFLKQLQPDGTLRK